MTKGMLEGAAGRIGEGGAATTPHHAPCWLHSHSDVPVS